MDKHILGGGKAKETEKGHKNQKDIILHIPTIGNKEC